MRLDRCENEHQGKMSLVKCGATKLSGSRQYMRQWNGRVWRGERACDGFGWVDGTERPHRDVRTFIYRACRTCSDRNFSIYYMMG